MSGSPGSARATRTFSDADTMSIPHFTFSQCAVDTMPIPAHGWRRSSSTSNTRKR